jgi:hypothetical protein
MEDDAKQASSTKHQASEKFQAPKIKAFGTPREHLEELDFGGTFSRPALRGERRKS